MYIYMHMYVCIYICINIYKVQTTSDDNTEGSHDNGDIDGRCRCNDDDDDDDDDDGGDMTNTMTMILMMMMMTTTTPPTTTTTTMIIAHEPEVGRCESNVEPAPLRLLPALDLLVVQPSWMLGQACSIVYTNSATRRSWDTRLGMYCRIAARCDRGKKHSPSAMRVWEMASDKTRCRINM